MRNNYKNLIIQCQPEYLLNNIEHCLPKVAPEYMDESGVLLCEWEIISIIQLRYGEYQIILKVSYNKFNVK